MLWKCFDKNSVKLKVTLIIGPLSCRGSCKIRIVCPSFRLSVQHFPQEWHISFFDFWHDGRYLEYLKTDKALSSRKIYFHPNLSKKGQNGPNNNNNNLKWTLILLLICQYIYGKTLAVQLWAICCQPIKLQGSLKCNISREKWMINFTFGMQINVEVFYKLILSFWLCIIRYYQSTQNEFAYLCGISGKAWVMKLILLAADKRKSLPQIENKIFGVHSHTCPKYPKQQVYNTFAISQGKHKGWVWLLSVDDCQRFLQSDTIILDMCDQTYPNYPK